MDAFEERLAEQVRQYRHLYHPATKDHRQQQVSRNSWREIGQTLNIDPEECKKKWNALRDRFVKARKRMKSKKSGDAGGYNTVPKLFIQLQWLDDSIKHRKTTSNMPASCQSQVRSVVDNRHSPRPPSRHGVE